MKNDMKNTLIFVVLVAVLGGCAVSEKNPSADNLAQPSAYRENALVADNDTLSTEENLDDSFDDEDFDLLEDEITEQMVEIADPLEPFNRTMYAFNDILYFWVVKPVAEAYIEDKFPLPLYLQLPDQPYFFRRYRQKSVQVQYAICFCIDHPKPIQKPLGHSSWHKVFGWSWIRTGHKLGRIVADPQVGEVRRKISPQPH